MNRLAVFLHLSAKSRSSLYPKRLLCWRYIHCYLYLKSEQRRHPKFIRW